MFKNKASLEEYKSNAKFYTSTDHLAEPHTIKFTRDAKKQPKIQKEMLNWLNTYEADLEYVQSAIVGDNVPSHIRAEAWAKKLARNFDLDYDTFKEFALTNPSALLPQTVVRNIVRTIEASGILSKVTTFENQQRLDWNIIVRSDFANPEAWSTADNAHVWALSDEENPATLKIEQNHQIINIQLNPGLVYKYTTLPRRITLLHPQLVGMILQEMADEVVRTIEAGIMWGEVYQTDDATSNYDWLKPINPTVNASASANRVFTITNPSATSILPIIAVARQAYGFWNGLDEPPHLVLNRTAWRELYTELLTKLQSFQALMSPIKAILGYTKEEIEKELGIKIDVVPDYNMADDPFNTSGATARFVIGDLGSYGVLFPDGRAESFSFFKLQSNKIELLNEILIAGDVINISKLFYAEYTLA